jgi:hypothetical protein
MQSDWEKQYTAQLKHQAENPGAPDLVYEHPCTLIFERPLHSYRTLPVGELHELAYGDATAALFMGLRSKKGADIFNLETEGKRLAEDDARTQWFLRAAALSEKSGPLIALAEVRYEHPIDRNEFVQRIALEMSAERMKDPRAQPDLWREKLKSHLAGNDRSEDDRLLFGDMEYPQGDELEQVYLDGVLSAAQWSIQYLDYASRIQGEVTGSTKVLDDFGDTGADS